MENNKEIVYVYISRPISLIKAQKKYRENHKDIMSKNSLLYYYKNKENEDFLEKRKLYQKEYYINKKKNTINLSVENL